MFLPSVHRDALQTRSSVPSLALNDQSIKCGFEGNNDIYGIGIRIGIYAQTIAVWFANYFLLSEAQVLRDTVSIFSVAVLVVSVLFASNPSDVHAVEAFILLQILAWSCIMGVQANSSYTTVNFRSTIIRRALKKGILLCNICLHVWYWWRGLDQMIKTPCGTYMMYVVKTNMFGWARKVMMALSVFVLTVTVYWTLIESMRPLAFFRMKKVREDFAEAMKIWEDLQVKENVESMDLGTTNIGSQASMQESRSQYSCSHSSLIEPLDTPTGVGGVSTPAPEPSDCEIPLEMPALVCVSPKPVSYRNVIDQLSLPEFAILRQVYESELYIQHCISASPYKREKDGKPLSPLLIIRSILFPGRYRSSEGKESSESSSPPSWLRCHLYILKMLFTFRFPSQAFVVYSHIWQSRLIDPLNGPFQMHAALTYTPSSKNIALPNWSTTSLASTLLLAHPSTPKKVWLAWYYALIDLSSHIFVILQLELTLVWNKVEGLTGLWTSVGQLIPFIIGVGGLCLVVGRWTTKWWEKRYGKPKRTETEEGTLLEERNERNVEAFGLEKDVRESYARWKEMYEAEIRAKS